MRWGVLSVTYIQFVCLFITFFLADESDPYSPFTEEFDRWLKKKLLDIEDEPSASESNQD